MRMVVIGGVAGGMSAAAKARRVNKSAEIVVFERGRFVSYGACGMPYFLSGDIHDYKELIVRTPEQFEKSGIKVNLGWEVKEIDPKKGEVYAESRDGKSMRVSYDSLVIATGASARKIPVSGADLEGVYTMKELEDAIKVDSYIKSRPVKKVAVVGAGFIGLELIDAFVSRGLKVISVDVVETPPPQFDEDMVSQVKDKALEKGVELVWGSRLEAIEGDGSVRGIKVDGKSYDVDMVVFAVGVKPNSEIAEKAGIELGVAGSIKVNERMQTNYDNIYSAGDCTHSYSAVTGKPLYLPLGSLANRHGRVAGTNAVGGNSVVKPISGVVIVKFFDLGLAKCGITEKEAKEEGFDYRTVVIKAFDRAHYYPGAGKLSIKLIWENGSGRILGAQMIGPFVGVKRIDVVSALICRGATIEDLKHTDLAYAPPFSPVWDPLLIAANQAVKD